jgi:multidrug resistance efflux pump
MNFIAYLIALVLPTKTVDRAVRTITKAAAVLAAAEDAQNQRVASLDAQITGLQADRSAAQAEAQRAARIAKRLVDLTA